MLRPWLTPRPDPEFEAKCADVCAVYERALEDAPTVTTFAGLGGGGASAIATTLAGLNIGWSAVNNSVSLFDAAVGSLDAAITTIRANAATLGSNVSLLNERLEFTTNYVNTQTTGSDKLTLADLNEEGAKLVALRTRQQLATQVLAFAGQAEKAVLQLFS